MVWSLEMTDKFLKVIFCKKNFPCQRVAFKFHLSFAWFRLVLSILSHPLSSLLFCGRFCWRKKKGEWMSVNSQIGGRTRGSPHLGSFWWWFLIWHLNKNCFLWRREGEREARGKTMPAFLQQPWLASLPQKLGKCGRQPIWKHSPQESLKFGREQMILMVFWDSCQPQSIICHLWRHFENWHCLTIKVNNPGKIRCICANENVFSYIIEISGIIY